ncbi:MAG: hypothetical protein LC731_04045, partial [Acidobacteria bacterium]|nr:hypothetical protein [Acidobacteriota bacterium]
MALKYPAGLKELIASGNYDAHAALDITLPGGTILHIATAELVITEPEPVTYASNLRVKGELKQALRKVTDMIELSAQNVDEVLGKTVLGVSQALNAARALLLYFYFAPDGTAYRLERLDGELSAARIDEMEVRIKLLSDLSSGGSVAANRSVTR